MFLPFSEAKLHFLYITLIISVLPLTRPTIFIFKWQASNYTCATAWTDKCNSLVTLVQHPNCTSATR